jgi:GLPGLI family protein
MHYIYTLLLTILLTQQNPIQEVPEGQITYEQTYFEINGNSNYFKAILIFNAQASLQISHRYGMDKIQGSALQTNGSAAIMAQSPFDEKGTLFYRNILTKEFITRGKAVKPFPAIIIKDNWLAINWKIENTYKKILEYNVQKATALYRGRKWTAWFAKDLTYPFGPGELHGLPGIILEAGDGTFQYTATEICYPCAVEKSEKIVAPYEERSYTIEEFVRMTDNMAVYSMLEFQKQGKTWMQDKSPMKCLYPATEKSILERRQRSVNTIYEWEDKNTKRAIYNKDTLDATVDYKAAREIGAPPPQTIYLPKSVNH